MCESCSRGLCSSGLRSSDRNCKGEHSKYNSIPFFIIKNNFWPAGMSWEWSFELLAQNE